MEYDPKKKIFYGLFIIYLTFCVYEASRTKWEYLSRTENKEMIVHTLSRNYLLDSKEIKAIDIKKDGVFPQTDNNIDSIIFDNKEPLDSTIIKKIHKIVSEN